MIVILEKTCPKWNIFITTEDLPNDLQEKYLQTNKKYYNLWRPLKMTLSCNAWLGERALN